MWANFTDVNKNEAFRFRFKFIKFISISLCNGRGDSRCRFYTNRTTSSTDKRQLGSVSNWIHNYSSRNCRYSERLFYYSYGANFHSNILLADSSLGNYSDIRFGAHKVLPILAILKGTFTKTTANSKLTFVITTYFDL